MTLQELASKEYDLHSKAIELYHRSQTADLNKELDEIFAEYKKVHQAYADMSSKEIEALKRGLFIQWYSMTEPPFLTGISDLDKEAEDKVIQSLNEFIASGKIDSELIWMINYYANWDWVFVTYKSFTGFDREIVNDENNELPDIIDREKMNLRGQMGQYWNSLISFNKDSV